MEKCVCDGVRFMRHNNKRVTPGMENSLYYYNMTYEYISEVGCKYNLLLQ